MIAGLLNAFRGKGFIPTWLFSVLVGFIFAVMTSFDSRLSFWFQWLGCALGVLIWKSAAWGNYFASFNRRWDRKRTDVKWIDWIGYKLVPFEAYQHESNRKRGLICMAIRGAVYSIPLFMFLGFTVHPVGFLLWSFMAMQGVIYWSAYWVKDDFFGGLQVGYAEFLTMWCMTELVLTLALAGAYGIE